MVAAGSPLIVSMTRHVSSTSSRISYLEGDDECTMEKRTRFNLTDMRHRYRDGGSGRSFLRTTNRGWFLREDRVCNAPCVECLPIRIPHGDASWLLMKTPRKPGRFYPRGFVFDPFAESP